MNIQSESFHGLVAMVCDVPTGMSVIRNLDTAKAVVRDIAPKTKLRWLLSRIAASRFPSELLAFLPQVYGTDHREVLPLLEALVRMEGGNFETEELFQVADHYWSLVVRERIVRGDYRRAWDEIRRSFRGLRPVPYTPDELLDEPARDVSEDMGASLPRIGILVNELFIAMREKELVCDIDEEKRYAVDFDGQWSKPAGILLAKATRNYRRYRPTNRGIYANDGQFTFTGRQILAIAEYYLQLQKQKRGKRIKRKLQGADN